MFSNKWWRIILVLVILVVVGVAVYQIPWVEQRASWRIDIAETYLRGMLQPVRAVPTPISDATSPTPGFALTSTPTAPPTLTASPFPADKSAPIPTSSPTPWPSPTPIPDKVELESTYWEKQDWNNCGPATLAVYLNYYGWEGDQFKISAKLKPQRGDRNVNVEELDHYTRNYAGWLQTQFRVGGDLDLLKEFVAAGIPVMVEASFGFEQTYWPYDDQWGAHYLLVTGYDEVAQTFIVQDTYIGANQIVSYEMLDEHWQPFNRVFILIYLPHQEETVQTILGPDWDVTINRENALAAAQTEIDADPQDNYAWFNLGTNLVYFERYAAAAAAYDEARAIGWPQRMLRYQFGPFFAYFHSGRNDDLLTLTEYAQQFTRNSEETFLWHGWALYRQGNLVGAMEDFEAALEANYLYQDARYALDFVLGQ
jgi:tetratricopeptide (TPR) repeat protein